MSKTQTIAISCANDVMKVHIKLLAHKKWNYLILEYFFKYKATKEVVSEIYIITTSSTEEIRE